MHTVHFHIFYIYIYISQEELSVHVSNYFHLRSKIDISPVDIKIVLSGTRFQKKTFFSILICIYTPLSQLPSTAIVLSQDSATSLQVQTRDAFLFSRLIDNDSSGSRDTLLGNREERIEKFRVKCLQEFRNSYPRVSQSHVLVQRNSASAAPSQVQTALNF